MGTLEKPDTGRMNLHCYVRQGTNIALTPWANLDLPAFPRLSAKTACGVHPAPAHEKHTRRWEAQLC